MPVISAAKCQRFFRIAAGLDVDKDDLKRYSEFITQKIFPLSAGRIAARSTSIPDRGWCSTMFTRTRIALPVLPVHRPHRSGRRRLFGWPPPTGSRHTECISVDSYRPVELSSKIA